MAFYKNVPEHKKAKTDYASKGSWEEEGSRYSQRREFKSEAEYKPVKNSRNHFSSDRNEHHFRTGTAAPGKQYFKREYDNSEKKTGYRDNDRQSYRKPADRDRYSGEKRNTFTRPEADNRSFVTKPTEEVTGYRSFEYKASPVTSRDSFEETPNENVLCGRNPIREALKSGRDIEKLLVQKGELSGSAKEIVQTAKENHIPVQVVEKIRMDEIVQHHQGLIAFASAYSYSSVEDILSVAESRNEAPFIIILDGITDPHNLGAIIRTAECVGAHGVIVPQRRSVGLTPAAVKASAGAIEHVKVARVVNINRTIEELKEKNVWTYALDMNGSDYLSVDFSGGVALVIGAEGEGISHLTEAHCDYVVSLPMAGKLDSLNASVAAGIIMYRVLACRK